MNNTAHMKAYRDPVEAMKAVEEDDRFWDEYSSQERAEIDFKYQRAIMQLIIYFPFFGFLASKLSAQAVWIKTKTQLRGEGMLFKTMATDGRRLYIWPGYVLHNDPESIVGVIMHELMHVILLHVTRARGYNRQLGNIAMDHAVNMMVNDIGRHMGKLDVRAPLNEQTYRAMPFRIGCPPFYYDERYRDRKTGDPWLWEKIYADLLKQQSPDDQKMLQAGGSLDHVRGAGGQMVDTHDFWDPENRPADEKGDVDQERPDMEEIRDMIRDSEVQAREAKSKGDMPASMQRVINEWIHPPLPWQRLVQRYLRPADGHYGYEPGDLRFPDPIPWYIPDFKLRYIVIAIDTSGSMSDREVGSSIEQARHLLKSFPQTKGILCMCDAEVGYWADLSETYTINRRVGCGGTDFTPPFEKIIAEKIEGQTDLLIYFTDGYGNFPTRDWLTRHKIAFDTLWVITNDNVEVPPDPSYVWTRLNPLSATAR